MLQTFNLFSGKKQVANEALIIYSTIAVYDVSTGEPVYLEYFYVGRR